MSVPDDCSWTCEICGSYNLQDGIIRDGIMYCDKCFKERKEGEKK